MRNYDFSPLLRQWIGFDNWLTRCKAQPNSRRFRRTTSKKAMITTTASRLRWPGSVRKISTSSLRVRA